MPAGNLPILSAPVHCLCATKQKNVPTTGIFSHHQKAPLPYGAIRKISHNVGISSPELALMQVANIMSFAELIGLMCEFCGAFSICDSAEHGMFSRTSLTSAKRIRSFADNVHNVTGIDSFKTASSYALDMSRSPAETAAALLLTLPRMRGGYGLRGAKLNQPIQLSAQSRRTAGIAKLEPDILWPERQVCIEYDSREFHREDGRIANDARRKNAFLLSDLHVITLTGKQLSNRQEMDKIAKQAATKIGKRWRRPDLQTQARLRNELLASTSAIRRSQELLRRAGQRQAPRAEQRVG